jgi:hypothetical protein
MLERVQGHGQLKLLIITYTKRRVVGTDLSPIQPELVPENADFTVSDLVNGLDFDTGSTDLVNSR